ncbi:MAG: low molecular weight protein-tyrosine-phosphatase [Flavobacteriales bacterium]
MKKNILFICLGNICRSPLAEGILKHKLTDQHHTIDSAATSGHHQGEGADPRSIAIAHRYGIDLSDLRSRPFQPIDFELFDHILVMDEANYRAIESLAKTDLHRKKIERILDYSARSETEVPDPYYGGDFGFENVYQLLNEACDGFIKKHKLC